MAFHASRSRDRVRARLVFPLSQSSSLCSISRSLIRPQQMQQKKRREMLEALKKGDKVITVGGVHHGESRRSTTTTSPSASQTRSRIA